MKHLTASLSRAMVLLCNNTPAYSVNASQPPHPRSPLKRRCLIISSEVVPMRHLIAARRGRWCPFPPPTPSPADQLRSSISPRISITFDFPSSSSSSLSSLQKNASSSPSEYRHNPAPPPSCAPDMDAPACTPGISPWGSVGRSRPCGRTFVGAWRTSW